MVGIEKDHKGIGTLLFSEVIEEIDITLTAQKPITPAFLHDLGSLTEAICLSNCYSWAQAQDKKGEKESLRFKGPVAETLIENKGLKIYFGHEIESAAEGGKKDFSFGEFLSKHYMFAHSFKFDTESFSSLTEQYIHFLNQWRNDPLKEWAEILGGNWDIVDSEGIYLSDGMPIGPHIYKVLESHRFKVEAAQYMAEAFDLDNLYLPLFGRPHIIGESYSKASNVIRDLLESAEHEISRIEEKFNYKNAFELLPIPNFARILLSEVNSRNEIPKQLIMVLLPISCRKPGKFSA